MCIERKRGFYEKYVKRFLDIICSLIFIIAFVWLYVIVAVIVRIKMGKPVLFKQPRPGMVKNGRETIFDIYKFRTMIDKRDLEGNLLSDEHRLPKFGALLRSTSLDELPEVFCILKGDMSVIGPRPQLVRDMVFMTDQQRLRHTAKPGLTGLAQIKGRNNISWEEKFDWDLKYIGHITFWQDLTILFNTIAIVFKRSGITDGDNVTSLDYGDALLKAGKVSKREYSLLQENARELIKNYDKNKRNGKV